MDPCDIYSLPLDEIDLDWGARMHPRCASLHGFMLEDGGGKWAYQGGRLTIGGSVDPLFAMWHLPLWCGPSCLDVEWVCTFLSELARQFA